MQSSNGEWKTCPPGTFDRYRKTVPAETRRVNLAPYLTGFAMGGVLAATIFGIALLNQNARSNQSAPTTVATQHVIPVLECADVIPLLHAYHQDKTDSLTRQGIAAHLSICKKCALEHIDVVNGVASHEDDSPSHVASR